METMNGRVESVARSGKGIQVNGEWYNSFTASQIPTDISSGDTVSFRYTETTKGDKTFRNIKGDVGKVAATLRGESPSITTAASSGGGYGGKSFPVPPLHPDRSIIRQNSLTHATRVVIDGCPMAAEHNPDDLANTIISVARIFEAYSTGEVDAEMARIAMGAAVEKSSAKE